MVERAEHAGNRQNFAGGVSPSVAGTQLYGADCSNFEVPIADASGAGNDISNRINIMAKAYMSSTSLANRSIMAMRLPVSRRAIFHEYFRFPHSIFLINFVSSMLNFVDRQLLKSFFCTF
jgi:hypothetical protein